jgi:hypothetical protein
MLHEGETFVEERIELGGNQFRNCSFESCRLVFDGSEGVRIEDCDFEETRLELVDQAGTTLSFLQNMYHGFGDDGQAVVENLFDQIREAKIGQPSTDPLPEDGTDGTNGTDGKPGGRDGFDEIH